MNKTLIATYPISANLHGGWSKIKFIVYMNVFESEGFVLGDLFSVGSYTERIIKWIGGKLTSCK